MLTYAQNFEDVVLARAFEGRSTGFYIDIGASHPEHLSVTKHFYDRGWRGVNVEPIPRAYQRFVEARLRDVNLNVAVGRERGEREFFECTDFDALSTFDPRQAEFLRKQGHTVVSYPVQPSRATTSSSARAASRWISSRSTSRARSTR
jgi:FkbM family methyltransferase